MSYKTIEVPGKQDARRLMDALLEQSDWDGYIGVVGAFGVFCSSSTEHEQFLDDVERAVLGQNLDWELELKLLERLEELSPYSDFVPAA